MNIITKSEINLDVEILKELLPTRSKSKYQLERNLAKKLGNMNVNYTAVHRRVKDLIKNEFIRMEKGRRKDGEFDRRGTHSLSLTYKGVIYLTLETDLDYKELGMSVQRALLNPDFRKFRLLEESSIQEISKASFEKMFKEIRPKVNLKYFDEEYVRTLVFEHLVIENILEEAKQWKKKLQAEHAPRKIGRLKKKAKKDAKRIPDEWIENLEQVYDYLRKKRTILNERIKLVKPILNEVNRYMKS